MGEGVEMYYVGLDLSTKTGFVVLSPEGNVLQAKEITAAGEGAKRMHEITNSIIQEVLKHQQLQVAVEGFSYGSKGSGQDFQYGVGWIVRTKLYEHNIPFVEVAPTSLKKFSGAKGNAPKEEVAVASYKRWGWESKSNNITDAFLLAHIARAIHEPVELTKFQQEVLDTIQNKKPKKSGRKKNA